MGKMVTSASRGRSGSQRAGRWARILGAAVMVVVLSGNVSMAVDPKLEETFKAFCAEWMQKLAVRERDNRAAIKWVNSPDGVSGEFVGYSTDNVCEVKEPVSPGATPVGTIQYRELRYRKVGPTKEEAAKSPDTAIEATEVTEIFRFAAGKWVY